ncbi:MAG: hypothetical protein JNN30_02385 [Rhodanobacteraceae bacterium]|nr:hypothetical protein [Rhodanobacteraceae bacterium]
MYKLPFRAAAGETSRAARSEAEPVPAFPLVPWRQVIAMPVTTPLTWLTRRGPALGPVLWLWRATPDCAADLAAVTGWNCVQRIEPGGICEALCFHRADGRELARLYLLPDSDYLAWEQLLQCVSCNSCANTNEPPISLHQRLREAARIRAGRPWQGAVVRFCHGMDNAESWLLAEAVSAVSLPGRRLALEICAGLDATLQG